ncbi:hypothetical protein SAMN05216241_10610 [Limimonas halophila]|uniref:Uncharacterized protein n=1 Tax=Limimonas halophila TaxID=1082479 RepID=A0A1G7RVB6_9PROT|nr:hypothetical protein [Limimonas halophila]SDG14682.1 hypothetical protein SAMN05216241_10610 [Limimonas halophila]
MTAAILSFSKRAPKPRDWRNQEIAEFHRAVDALSRAGFQVETDRGLTDEGEPWFVFVRPDSEEVIAHFARLDGTFIADAGLLDSPVRANDLREALNRILDQYEVLVPRAPQPSGGTRLSIHPAAMLTAFVATALMQLRADDARASTPGGEVRGGVGAGKPGGGEHTSGSSAVQTGAMMTAAIAAVGLAATPVDGTGAVTTVSTPALPGIEALAAILHAPDEAGAGAEDAPRVQLVSAHDAASDLVGGAGRDGEGRSATAPHPVLLPADTADENGQPFAQLQAPRPELGFTAEPVTAAPNAAEPESPAARQLAVAQPQAETTFTAADSLQVDPIDFQGVTLDAEGARTLLRALLPDERREDDAPANGDAPADGEDGESGESGAPWHGISPGDDTGNGDETGSGGDQPDAGGPEGDEPKDGESGGDSPGHGGDPDSAAELAELAADRAAALTRSVNYVFDNRADAQDLYLDKETFAGETALEFQQANDGDLPTVVAFESDQLELDAFAFMPGVIFMEADALTPQLDVADSPSITIDLADGGAISLVGIGSVEALTA